MDFLSTGEKIKRARIYKGMTLKELCKTDISISKMSCIENGKITPEKWVLDLVADRLDLDIKYLMCDDISQLKKSIELYSSRKEEIKDNECEEIIKNVKYCISRGYFDLGFELMHILFESYVIYRKFDKIPLIIDEYDLLYENKVSSKDIYYEDLSKYFMARKDYKDAITYFNILLNILKTNGEINNSDREININILTSICYKKIGDIESSEAILSDILKKSDKINDKSLIGLIYGKIVELKILKNEDYREDLALFEELTKGNIYYYAESKVQIGEAYLNANKREDALKAFSEIEALLPKDNKMKYTEILLFITEALIKNNELENCLEYCDKALELSINLNNLFFIQLSYYYKSKIAKAQGSFIHWEMYMNLSTDLLLKFGTYNEKNERYLEMADMYHIIGETREALKYLSLYFELQKMFY